MSVTYTKKKKWKDLRPTQRKVRTAKGKGKTFERYIAAKLNEVHAVQSLSAREMGQPGSDIHDPFKVLEWDYTEAKHWKKYPSLGSVAKLLDDADKGLQVFFYKANRLPVLVIMEEEAFLNMLRKMEGVNRANEELRNIISNVHKYA